MIRIRVWNNYTITEEGFINHNIIPDNVHMTCPKNILSSDFVNIPIIIKGKYSLLGEKYSKTVLFCPDYWLLKIPITDTEIKFVVYDLPKEQFSEILSKCERDKLLYQYKKIRRHLYKIPINISFCFKNRFLEQKLKHILLINYIMKKNYILCLVYLNT